MFKRTRWASVGYMAGVGTSVYVARRVRDASRNVTAQAVAERVGSTVVSAGERVRLATVAGRDAMREREAELRRAIDAR